MAYLHVCDRCGVNLDYARSYYKVRVETIKDGTMSSNAKDYCKRCFDEIKELASSPYASVSYNTPGAR